MTAEQHRSRPAQGGPLCADLPTVPPQADRTPRPAIRGVVALNLGRFVDSDGFLGDRAPHELAARRLDLDGQLVRVDLGRCRFIMDWNVAAIVAELADAAGVEVVAEQAETVALLLDALREDVV